MALVHGCARVAHCVTARLMYFPLLLSTTSVWRLIYVFWAQRSTDRCADSTRCTQTRVHCARGKYIVRHWTSRQASLRHSSSWRTWSVSPQSRDLRTRGLVGYHIPTFRQKLHSTFSRVFYCWNETEEWGYLSPVFIMLVEEHSKCSLVKTGT